MGLFRIVNSFLCVPNHPPLLRPASPPAIFNPLTRTEHHSGTRYRNMTTEIESIKWVLAISLRNAYPSLRRYISLNEGMRMLLPLILPMGFFSLSSYSTSAFGPISIFIEVLGKSKTPFRLCRRCNALHIQLDFMRRPMTVGTKYCELNCIVLHNHLQIDHGTFTYLLISISIMRLFS